MQQATSSIDNRVSTVGARLTPKAAAPPRFVINLCASTTPVGLVQPTHAGLKRFTFFVSRRLEEGRERFRLHMGYFDSQEEAEKILDLVRDVYPAAWAGVAPGIKLRARAALPEPAPIDEPAAAPVAVAPAPAAPAVAAAPSAKPPVAEAVAVPPATPAAAESEPLKLELAPDLPRAKPAPVPTPAPATAPATARPPAPASADATTSLIDVRATIASLSDTAEVPAPAAPAAAPVLEGAAVLRLLTSARPSTAARLAPAQPAAKRNTGAAPPNKAAPARIEKPVAPATAAQPEQAIFAVQLLWSVQPIDMSQVPQLAIFSAYTLYGAEGNRGGRRWYGLRLGFFTDAVSAKQVAQYVRSEFNSVSVVPVTDRERTRAGAANAKPLPALASPKADAPELHFIEEVSTDTATSGSRPALEASKFPASKSAPTLQPAVVAALGMGTRASPGKRAKLRGAPAGKTGSKRANRPLSLEETLEILGAGELQMESGRRRDLLSESAVRDRKQPAASGSRFGRLINRLAERLGNG